MIENPKEDILAANRVAIRTRLNQILAQKEQVANNIAALKKDIELPEHSFFLCCL